MKICKIKFLKEIILKLENLFPLSQVEKFDNSGLLYGDLEQKVTKCLVTLDITKEVLNTALKEKINLIISHHPFIFESQEEDFKFFPYKRALDKIIQKNKIAIYTLHTNFDVSSQGMLKIFSEKLNLNFQRIRQVKYGFQSKINMNFLTIKNLFFDKLKKVIFNSNIKNYKHLFKKIIIFPGAGSVEELQKIPINKLTLVITSDIKWSTWILAKEKNIFLAQVDHNIENVFIERISQILKNDVQIFELKISK